MEPKSKPILNKWIQFYIMKNLLLYMWIVCLSNTYLNLLRNGLFQIFSNTLNIEILSP